MWKKKSKMFWMLIRFRQPGSVVGEVHLSVTRTREKIVKAYHRSPQRLEFEQLVKYTIRDRGYYYVDQLLPNKEGQYLNNNKDGQMYTVRDWFEGRECDVKMQQMSWQRCGSWPFCIC